MSSEKPKRDESAGAAARAEAAERLLRAHDVGVDPHSDLATVAWRRESDINDAAFRHVTQAWDEAARAKERSSYAQLLGTPTLRERVVAAWHGLIEQRPGFMPSPRWALASIVAAMVLAGSWFLTPTGNPTYATQVAEIRDVPLDDGTVVTLGARSAVDVQFTNAERTVRLASGEAFFAVSRDTSRPFVVLAGDTRIRVVGTKFNVHYEGGRVRVSVLEGIVEVARADGSTERIGPAAPTVTLTAGQQLLAAGSAPLAPEPLRGATPGAWREGRLDYQDAPLSEIIADANRYRSGTIRIASPALAGERLTTSFRTSQIDQMLETLPETLPVALRRNPDGTVELRSTDRSGD